MLPGCENIQELKTFKLFRGAKPSGIEMTDIEMIIKDII